MASRRQCPVPVGRTVVRHPVIGAEEKGLRFNGRSSVLTEGRYAREGTHCAGGDDFYESTTFCVRHKI